MLPEDPGVSLLGWAGQLQLLQNFTGAKYTQQSLAPPCCYSALSARRGCRALPLAAPGSPAAFLITRPSASRFALPRLCFPAMLLKTLSPPCTTPGLGSCDGTYHLKRILYGADSPQHLGSAPSAHLPARAGSQHPRAPPCLVGASHHFVLRPEGLAGLQAGG